MQNNKADSNKKLNLKEFIEILRKDKFIQTLLLSNLFIAFLAINDQQNPFEMVFGYFIQTVIIGFFAVVEIFSLKKYSTEGLIEIHLLSKATQSPTSIKTKIYAASDIAVYFFINCFLFGFVMISSFTATGEDNFIYSGIYAYLPALSIFVKMKNFALSIFIAHLIAYIYGKIKEKGDIDRKIPNLKDTVEQFEDRTHVQFFVSLSFFMFFSSSYTGYIPIIMFLLVKTFFDIAIYYNRNIAKGKFANKPRFL